MKGTVKWFNAKKGFGFLEGEDGTDYFVHYSEIQSDGYRNLDDGEKVEFVAGTNARGAVACDVVREVK